MNVIDHTITKLEDPTGILEGDRYEFTLSIEVPEDDELYSEHGLYMKMIFVVNENGGRVAQSHFYEKSTNKPLDFELEEDEEAVIKNYCMEQL